MAALLLVNKERSAYGLRYNDFARYRKHCGNKVHRLRSSLKLTHGKGKSFKKLPEISVKTSNYLSYVSLSHPMNQSWSFDFDRLQLLLFEAERLYAFAQDLYRLQQQHKAIAKHRRALLWANKLLSVCLQLPADRLSASCLCEILVYTHMLAAKFALKRDQFELSIKHHTVAYQLLLQLQKLQRSSRDQALYDVYVDEIAPELRFSAHELGFSRSHEVIRLVSASGPKNCTELVRNYNDLSRRLTEESSSSKAGNDSRELKAWLWKPRQFRYGIRS